MSDVAKESLDFYESLRLRDEQREQMGLEANKAILEHQMNEFRSREAQKEFEYHRKLQNGTFQ